ncbi:CrcB-like protein (macronuclear) [Tetrahymena thermophila SB210]|uniref:CrcB-like protein n=1 Tax=Tetrahymena thermophila (strain SB210) TaxID=312017 RepID=Q23G77_TETTS|nr:CrcB-like protein [Tetrahymena thermophila SB210]EAR95383.2 CrcB-like protein [Tetrahymena thermophila SB210]|eukprot:XP_001015628.2 CrcB-like protein [Tetrahymena thermophila SB210]
MSMPQQQVDSHNQVNKNRYYEIAVILFIISIEIIGFSIAFSSYFDLNYLYEILFGPIGALPRYILSTKLNYLFSCFQLGTLLSNWFGTVIAFILQVTCIEKSVCYQIQFGSMGSLSTVSSWANDTINNFEKNKLRSLLYNLGTFGVCIISAIIVNELSKINN